MIKSRDDLKSTFRSGAIPTASDFANLIDSLAHVDEVAPLSKQIDAIDARTAAVEQKVLMPATRAVDADGTWQILKSDVDALCAFEILAQIDKSKLSPFAAVTHAIAVSAATRSRPTVRQTKSYSQWYWPWIIVALIVTTLIGATPVLATAKLLGRTVEDIVQANSLLPYIGATIVVISLIGIVVSFLFRDRRAITVGWRSDGKWLDPQRKYDLVIRSGQNYGSKTQKVQINCQIKRLWN